MPTKKLILRLVFSLMVLAIAVPVSAVDDPLDAFSEDVSVVVRLQKPTDVTGNLVKYISNVDEQYGQMAQGLSGLVGLLISNPSQQGVDKEKDWWIAILPSSGEPPKVIFAIPASNVDEMKSAIPDSYTSTVFENWLIYSDNGEAVSAIEEGIKAKSIKSIRGKIDSEASKLLTGSSIGAFINVNQLTEIYKDEIDMGIQQAEERLKQFQNMAPPMQGMDISAIFGIYTDIFHGAVQAVKDADAITVGIKITGDDLIVERLTQLEKDSETDKFLSVHKTSKMDVLNHLSVNQLGYFGIHCDTKSLVNFSMDLMTKMMPEGTVSEDEVNKIKAQINALSIGAYVGSFNFGPIEEGAIRMTSIYEATPADKVKELAQAYVEFSKNLQYPMMKQEITLEKEVETVGGHKIDIMTVIQEMNEEVDPLGIQKQLMEAMYGPGGIKARIAYLDRLVVQTVGGGQESMKAALTGIEGTPSESVSSSVRSKLSESANLIGLIDLPSLAIKAITLVVDSGKLPLPLDTDGLKELGIRPSYLGVSVAIGPQTVRGRLVIPAQQVQGIAKMVQYFQSMRQQSQF